jgi:hypothetical protein
MWTVHKIVSIVAVRRESAGGQRHIEVAVAIEQVYVAEWSAASPAPAIQMPPSLALGTASTTVF